MTRTIYTRETEVQFQVVADKYDGTFLVRERTGHYSFSYVPFDHQNTFNTKAMALEQVRRLGVHQRKGNTIRLIHLETPGCFEQVADTKYGAAWE